MYPKPITTTSDTFTFSGHASQIFLESSVEEILNAFQPIQKVGAHALEERQLFLANTTTTSRDYSLYQQYASAVKVTYTASQISSRQSKKGEILLFGETLCPDEIYALGIVYVHNDGTTSPVFHIPGRPANLDMTGHEHPYISSHTDWDTDNIIGDSNVFNDTKSLRWQAYSTATIETAESNSTFHTGYLGYYETTTVYPEIENCEGNAYWGQDYYGNNLEGTPIRHHRMPGQYMYVGSGQASYPQYDINLTFDNVELPDDVVGWFIVYGDRSEERTVLDRGYFRQMNWDPTDEVLYHSYLD